MNIYTLLYVPVALAICFAIYKLVKKIITKTDSRSLWKSEDEGQLKEILNRIYSCSCLESLKNESGQCTKTLPKYRNLFKEAIKEKTSEIKSQQENLSFEIIENRVRKMWIVTFASYYIYSYYIGLLAILIKNRPHPLEIKLSAATGFTISYVTAALGMYYFGYRKKGTIVPQMAVGVFFYAVTKPFLEGNSFVLSIENLISLALHIFYCFSCILLWRINLQIKARKQLSGLKEIMQKPSLELV